ncbi:peptide ABC transporter substrate-binding protein [Clostridium uliginosum]|uniref:Oligopeptide transport system substrate-binding protein n=1 Tax=Clostridium uliginosum TaxID=119641 RepID=A0A1I1K3N8_9CLOT|nr:peptide ABC transporter substrate-binding protein [Clostridium uliginosum]SFC55205.1 oligopeptide transport system substrate-binding protein [Clostridium uliginosum]
MKKSKLKKLCAVTLALTLGMSVLVGCGGSANKTTAKAQVLTYNLNADPKTLDPALNASVDGAIVVSNTFEGLCKLDEKDKAIAGVAEKWDVSKDGTVYTFHLRDSKWSNGDTVKAGDFEYAWKRVLNPTTAAEYAYQMSYLKNANEYNQGKVVKETGVKATADDVGVKAIDDKTLEVTLAEPCSYFLELTAFPCYFPVNKALVENNSEWALKAETYISNGPFKMTDYKIKDQIVLEKNENYYGKDNVKLDKVNMKLVTEETSAWASYKTGDFDMVDVVPNSETQTALKDGTATAFKALGTYFYVLNLDKDKVSAIDPEAAKVLSDSRVRKALNLAVDRPSIVENITKGGQIPAHSFVAEGIPGPDGKDFAQKEYFSPKANIEEAKKLLAEAGYPDGKGFPTLIATYNPESGNGDIAQALQDMWKNNLGITVELQSQEWKVFQKTRTDGKYEIGRHAWLGDYVDPMTFLEMWQSTSGLNVAKYKSPEYDKLLQGAKVEQDATKRIDLMHKAEDVLMEDMPIVPLYYYVSVKGVKSYVKDVRVSPLGFIYFDKAYIEGK